MTGGTHVISIGARAIPISSFGCIMHVEGDDPIDSTIIIDSTLENSLKFEMDGAGSIFIYDLVNQIHFFRIFYIKIARIIINFGQNTHLIFHQGSLNTEYQFNFPAKSSQLSFKSIINISAASNSVMITGDTITNIGTKLSNTDPFLSINGLLAFYQSYYINIVGDKGDVPAQHYTIDGTCINSLNRQSRAPTHWFCTEMSKRNFMPNICSVRCSIAYLGNNITTTFRTGTKEDSFEGCDVNTNLEIYSDSGDDKIVMGPNNPAKRLYVDTGEGNDRIDFFLPIGKTFVLLNETVDIKIATFHQANYLVNQYPNNYYYPVGPFENCSVTLKVAKWVDLYFDEKSRVCTQGTYFLSFLFKFLPSLLSDLLKN